MNIFHCLLTSYKTVFYLVKDQRSNQKYHLTCYLKNIGVKYSNATCPRDNHSSVFLMGMVELKFQGGKLLWH